MNRFTAFALAVASLFFALTLVTGDAGASSLDPSAVINAWSSEGTPGDAIEGNLPPVTPWSLETVGGVQVISTGGNTSGSLVSDFVAVGDFTFSGQFMPVGDGDQDNTGFVFGWQSVGDNYSVLWGGHPDDRWNGNYRIADTQGGSYSEFVTEQSRWIADNWYDFSVQLSGGQYQTSIALNGSLIHADSFAAAAFSSGRVGIQTYSQSTYYRNLAFVPEPSTSLLMGIGLFFWLSQQRSPMRHSK